MHYHVRLTCTDGKSFVEVGAYVELSKAQEAEEKALANIESESGSKYSIRKVMGGKVIHKINPKGILDEIDQMLHIMECSQNDCLCPRCQGDVIRGGIWNLTRYCLRCNVIL